MFALNCNFWFVFFFGIKLLFKLNKIIICRIYHFLVQTRDKRYVNLKQLNLLSWVHQIKKFNWVFFFWSIAHKLIAILPIIYKHPPYCTPLYNPAWLFLTRDRVNKCVFFFNKYLNIYISTLRLLFIKFKNKPDFGDQHLTEYWSEKSYRRQAKWNKLAEINFNPGVYKQS